jgi:hypothetical protein
MDLGFLGVGLGESDDFCQKFGAVLHAVEKSRAVGQSGACI